MWKTRGSEPCDYVEKELWHIWVAGLLLDVFQGASFVVK